MSRRVAPANTSTDLRIYTLRYRRGCERG